MSPRVEHFNGGRRVAEPGGGAALADVNPATGEVLGEVALESVASAEAAVTAARDAFRAWSATPVGKRCPVLACTNDPAGRYDRPS